MRGRRHPEGRTEKPCTRCGVTKPLSSFSPDRKSSDGRAPDCHECKAALARQARASRSPEERKRIDLLREAKRRINTEAVWRFLSTHPCVDCGEDDPVVLDFDHVYGEKKNHVSRMLGSHAWESIAAEIEKCVVRCANCHRRKTAVELNFYAYLGRDHNADAAEAIALLTERELT